MWKCEVCGRVFKRNNQGHFCSNSEKTVDAYIKIQTKEVQVLLVELRKTLLGVLPKAKEKIAWGMPTYWEGKNIIHFAAYKNHIGLYPGPEAVVYFADALKDYKTSKGAIQFSYDVEIPYDLIGQIALWCYETGNHH